VSVGGLVATPKQIGVGCYAGQTMFAANGKLLMPACTLGNGHPIGMQNTTRADIPAGDDNVMPARRFPRPHRVNVFHFERQAVSGFLAGGLGFRCGHTSRCERNSKDEARRIAVNNAE
jgi:hypothetical protein